MSKLLGEKLIKALKERTKTHKTRVIHALDIADTYSPGTAEAGRKELIERACHVAVAVAPHIVALKLNYPLVLATGLEIVHHIKSIIPDLPLIADFKVADIDNTNAWIARHTFAAGFDAIIVHGFIGDDAIQGVIKEAHNYGDRGVILLVDMSHPGATEFIHPQTPRLIALALKLKVTGVIAPGTRPAHVSEIRHMIGADPLILAPGVGAQGGKPGSAISAGADYEIIGRTIYTAKDPAQKAQELATQTFHAPSFPRVSRQQAMIKRVALLLAEVGAIKFGDFTLASGKKSPYYIDLRIVPSSPDAFMKLTDLFLEWLSNHPRIAFDRIAGIPTAGISLATSICNRLGIPLLYIRSQSKEYGRKQQIEGILEPGDHVLVIDDLITDGASKIDAVQILREAGAKVTDVLVVIDREQGGAALLKQENLSLHALATISHLTKALSLEQQLSKTDADRILSYIASQNRSD